MKIYQDDKLIKRNKTIGNVLSIASIAILGAGMFLSFSENSSDYLPYSFAALILGFLVFQVGNFYMLKWGKSPRPDEQLSQALKGLDSNYSLYHYKTYISHLLVGPAGIFALLPYNQSGFIEYDESRKRWKQRGGNFFLKTFGGESLGRPDLDAKYAVSDLQKLLKKLDLSTGEYVPQAILVFTNPKAVTKSESSPIPALPSEKVKEYIRKQLKTNNLSPELIAQVKAKLEERLG
jgi:hypothetical protein